MYFLFFFFFFSFSIYYMSILAQFADKFDLHLWQNCNCDATVDADDREANERREGEHGCAEIQIFARKLITRINSSQNIQTGCQTVRLHTPTSGCEPNTAYPTLDRTAVHTFARVTRVRPIQYTYYMSTCILRTSQLITNGFAGRLLFRFIVEGCRQLKLWLLLTAIREIIMPYNNQINV